MSTNESSKVKPNDKDLESYLDQESPPVFQRETFGAFLKHVLEYKKILAICFLLVAVSTIATIAEPRLFGLAIDDAILPKNFEFLKKLVLLYFLFEALRIIAIIGAAYYFNLLGQKVMQDLRLKLFSHLQRLPLATYDKVPNGKLVTRITNDINSLSEMFTSGMITILQNVLVIVGTMIALVMLDTQLGLISISVFPFMVIAAMHFSGRLRITYRNSRSKLSALNAYLAENILGMRVIQLFNRQKLHFDRYRRLNSWYADAQFGTVKVYALFHPTITLATGLSMALIIWYGSGRVVDGSLKLGILVASFAYALALFQPVREVADKWNVFLSGMASAERVFEILNWPAEDLKPRNPIPLNGHIVFENVWFAYNNEEWVLKDFSFEIKPGEHIGIVGPTGSGKTTIISLLMRFYEPQKGRILIDGKDIREFDKRGLRSSIGLIQQDVFLFTGSIAENISLWRKTEPTEFDILFESERFRSIHERQGQRLNERGMNLSMGERQVISFARALYSKPSVWILDEATANIDSESERELEILLNKASEGRTSLAIAHRLATIRNADKILVLSQGVLAEAGNHDELLRGNGLYARLYRYQEAANRAGIEVT